MDFRNLVRAKPQVATHLKSDFAAFCRAAWPVLHPGSRLSWVKGHDAICDYLVAVHEGQIRRLIVNCPPRFAKTTILNCFLVWCWLQDPTRSFLSCSYEIDLALNGNADRRKLMESQWFRSLFSDVFTLSQDRSQAGDFQNDKGGSMRAASTNSRAQGRGGSIIVVDDPNSADTIFSESFRNETNAWLTFQLPQRLDNPSESAIILIQQRLHQDDCTGHLLAEEESPWEILKLPLVAEQDEEIKFPHSGKTWRRRKGEVLDPKRWTPKTIRQRMQNRLVWAGQFQQEPVPVEGNLVRVDDVMFFGGRDSKSGTVDPGLPEKFERKIISVDASFKNKSTSDFVAIAVVGVVGSKRFVLRAVNSHLDVVGTENEIRALHSDYAPISAVLVEDAANGPAIISRLSEQIPGVIAVTPEGGKVSRLMAVAPEFAAHNWYFERHGTWTNEIVSQLTMFPNARHDDLADCVSQAAVWLQTNSGGELGLISWFKKKAAEATESGTAAPVAARAKTPQETRVDGFKVWQQTNRAPKCEVCRSESTTYIPGTGGRGAHYCNQCHATDGIPAQQPEKPGHVHRWHAIPGNQVRCDDCEEQRYVGTPPTVNGVTFAQHRTLKGGWPRGRFWD